LENRHWRPGAQNRRDPPGSVSLQSPRPQRPAECGALQPTAEARRENSAIAGQARADLTDLRDEVLVEFEEEIADLRHHFGAMQARIEPRQDALAAIAEDAYSQSQEHIEAINAEAEAFYERADELWTRIGEALEERVADADEIEWTSPAEPEETDDPLFDSSRDYVEQVNRYKFHLGKPTGRRGAGNWGGRRERQALRPGRKLQAAPVALAGRLRRPVDPGNPPSHQGSLSPSVARPAVDRIAGQAADRPRRPGAPRRSRQDRLRQHPPIYRSRRWRGFFSPRDALLESFPRAFDKEGAT
jgi:hypothetical protein